MKKSAWKLDDQRRIYLAIEVKLRFAAPEDWKVCIPKEMDYRKYRFQEDPIKVQYDKSLSLYWSSLLEGQRDILVQFYNGLVQGSQGYVGWTQGKLPSQFIHDRSWDDWHLWPAWSCDRTQPANNIEATRKEQSVGLRLLVEI